MKLILTLLIYLIFFHSAYATDSDILNSKKSIKNDIKIIELHNKSIDQKILEANQNLNNQDSTNNDDITTSNIVIEDQIVEEDSLSSNDSKSNEEIISNEEIMTLPDFWERADKNEILFLLDNMLPIHSEVLNNNIIESFTLNSTPPQNFTENEFNHMRIVNLIKLGQRKKAF